MNGKRIVRLTLVPGHEPDPLCCDEEERQGCCGEACC